MATRPDTNGHALDPGRQRPPLWTPFSATTPDPDADADLPSPGAFSPDGTTHDGTTHDGTTAGEAPTSRPSTSSSSTSASVASSAPTAASPATAGSSGHRGPDIGSQPAVGLPGTSPDDGVGGVRMAPWVPRAELARYEPDPTRDEQALSSAQLLRPVRRPPRSGWRAALYTATGGLLNPGESPADVARRELSDRVNQRLSGCYRVAALSLKGGVGKTATTALLGSAFASLRGDRVIALDANPDRGNLAEKVPQETSATVRHLLDDAEHIRTAADVRAYTSQASSRLEVLASESDPEVSEAFNAADYQAAVDLLSRHYNLILTDCGTGLLHSALQAAVSVADSLLIVTSASIDGARSAQATVEWLEAHGHRDLVARSVTVINGVRTRPGTVDLDAVERFFARHTRDVVRIPFDRHLDEGAEIDLTALTTRTRDALLHLAAVVADDFARPGRRPAGSSGHARRTGAVLPGGAVAPGTVTASHAATRSGTHATGAAPDSRPGDGEREPPRAAS